MGEEYLGIAELAERLGVSPASVVKYNQRAKANREAGTPKPGDLPPPDRHFGKSPAWLESTIKAWESARPGRGAGGGRPRRATGPRES